LFVVVVVVVGVDDGVAVLSHGVLLDYRISLRSNQTSGSWQPSRAQLCSRSRCHLRVSILATLLQSFLMLTAQPLLLFNDWLP